MRLADILSHTKREFRYWKNTFATYRHVMGLECYAVSYGVEEALSTLPQEFSDDYFRQHEDYLQNFTELNTVRRENAAIANKCYRKIESDMFCLGPYFEYRTAQEKMERARANIRHNRKHMVEFIHGYKLFHSTPFRMAMHEFEPIQLHFN